jgi:hypothetical protein
MILRKPRGVEMQQLAVIYARSTAMTYKIIAVLLLFLVHLNGEGLIVLLLVE